MLWMKSWLEIRWRVLFALIITSIGLGGRLAGVPSGADLNRMIGAFALLWLFDANFLAGAGVKTQSPFVANKGLHGSTLFTLSLPVTRFRLLAVRAGIGLLATLAIILATIASVWILFPLVRAMATPADLLMWLFTTSCCAAAFYALSVLVSTCVDDQWQIWGTFFATGLLKWLTVRFPPPPSFDVFRVMAEGSPLFTHTLTWPAISVSLGLAVILFFIAVKVVQTREY